MKAIRIITVLACMAAAGAAYAAPPTATFQVTTNAFSPTQCGVGASDLVFAAYNPVSATPSYSFGSVVVACTAGRAFTVYPDSGMYSLSGQTRMANQTGVGYMNYDAYTDAGYTTKWSTANKFSGTGTGIGNYIPHTVYGRVAGGQGAADGSQDGTYHDRLVVTVEFN